MQCRYRDDSTVRCAIGNARYIEIKDDEAVVKATSLPARSLIIIISSHVTRKNALNNESLIIKIAGATSKKKVYIIIQQQKNTKKKTTFSLLYSRKIICIEFIKIRLYL